MSKSQLIVLGVVVLAFVGLGTKAWAQNATAKNAVDPKSKEVVPKPKILIAYYSYSGNTRAVAEEIQKATGGDLFEIVPMRAYSSDYKTVVAEAKEEIQSKKWPALKNNVANIADYDLVFIGAPNWWSTIAPPVTTFLKSHDLAGKKVAPFITHGSGGVARTVDDIKSLTPKSTALDAFAAPGKEVKKSLNKVHTWLRKIGVSQ